jgi:predicted small metal-binding protein
MRKVLDCRQMPSDSNCSLTIAGTEDEVLRAGAEHAVSVHGHTDGPELRAGLRAGLVDEMAVAGR